MAHELYMSADGTAAAAYGQEPAWHRLGVEMPTEMSVEDALRYSRLADWNVRKTPLYTLDVHPVTGEETYLPVPERFGMVHDNPFTREAEAFPAAVGSYYEAFQNEVKFEVLQNLVSENDLRISAAGALRGGTQTFLSMRVPDTMQVGGQDPVDLFVTALNSHDGSTPFTLLVSPVRVVCANTQAAALGSHRGIYKIRHTKSGKIKIEEARRALDLSFAYMDEFEAEAERMISESLTTDEFHKIITREFGPAQDASPRIVANAEARIDEWMHLWSASPTNADIRGTRWAGYQVFTEWHDHYAKVNGGGNEDYTRALRSIGEPVMSAKERAFDLFRVPAKVG